MPAGALLAPAFWSGAAPVEADGVALTLVLTPRVVEARVELAAVKAEVKPTLGATLVVRATTSVVLGAADDEGEEVVDGVVATTTEEEVVGAGLEVVVGVGATELVVGAWEVEVVVGTGASEVRAPVTPCLAAQSPRFMPLAQQKVSAPVSCVQ